MIKQNNMEQINKLKDEAKHFIARSEADIYLSKILDRKEDTYLIIMVVCLVGSLISVELLSRVITMTLFAIYLYQLYKIIKEKGEILDRLKKSVPELERIEEEISRLSKITPIK